MKSLFATFALLGGLTTVAVADDKAEEAPKAEAKAEETDCSKLEGDAKTKCDADKAAAETEATKGSKSLEKSNDNRMEKIDEDE